MKTYYSSSSHSNLDTVLAILMCLAIGGSIVYATDIIWIQLISILITIGIVVVIISYQRKRTFTIKFLENEIIIEYKFLKKRIQVPYADLLVIEFLSIHKSSDKNRIKFKTKNQVQSLSFLAIAHSDHYIEFIKWLKTKNEKLELKVFPSDHILNHKIQEIYGFKYRKMLKKTL
ncbi:hypothetical protein [Winogradskyella sp. SM1960]|uniref:hypothetical protein n=1 Tax=Winogradskyella sp. SM1960 TaxID=2865955 RepID=UPI001CD36AB4|nr:hypothetical protein [Winogradskyella sp. SM1960]